MPHLQALRDEYHVTAGATISPGDDVPSPGSIRIAYHVHTGFSYDCTTSLEAVLERASSAGLGCLCITDHDTIEGALALQRIGYPGVEIVIGCEFTAEDGSHVIGLNLTEMISEKRLPLLLERIQAQGALVVLPHPFRRGTGIFRNEMARSDAFVRGVLSATDIVECFNGGDNYANNQRSYRLATERGLPAVAGSDAHTATEIGSVFVEYAEDDRVHGISPRRVFFPPERPVKENAVKRRLMELYHRHQMAFPAVVREVYRISRTRRGRSARRTTEAAARLQYESPRARSGARHER